MKPNKVIIPCIYDNNLRFVNGLALVKKSGKCGIIDTTGKEIVSCTYDYMDNMEKDMSSFMLPVGQWGFNDQLKISNGLITVQKNGKWGFIDTTGKEITPLIYDAVESFSEGLAQVQKNDKWGFIDQKGKEVIPIIYDDAWGFSENIAKVILNGATFYIDKQGKRVNE